MDAELRHLLEAAFPGEDARYFLPMFIGSTPEWYNLPPLFINSRPRGERHLEGIGVGGGPAHGQQDDLRYR
jgi:hypothetical protein